MLGSLVVAILAIPSWSLKRIIDMDKEVAVITQVGKDGKDARLRVEQENSEAHRNNDIAHKLILDELKNLVPRTEYNIQTKAIMDGIKDLVPRSEYDYRTRGLELRIEELKVEVKAIQVRLTAVEVKLAELQLKLGIKQ